LPTTNARLYAQALLDILESEEDLERVASELERVRGVLLRVPALGRVLSNPRVPDDRKRGFLEQALGGLESHPATRGIIAYLAQDRRLLLLPEVAATFVRLKDRRLGTTAAEVVTAAPVEESDKEAWRSALGRVAGTRVRVGFRTDPSLIAGAVAKVGSVQYDGSVRGSLQRIRRSLLGD